jgi:hypothetical protein
VKATTPQGGQRGLVLGVEGGQDLHRGHARAGGLELALHAPAGVQQQEQPRGGGAPAREVLELLRAAVLVHADLLALEVGHRPAALVHRGRGEDDEVGPAGEPRQLRRGGGGGGGQEQRGEPAPDEVHHVHTIPVARGAPAAVL